MSSGAIDVTSLGWALAFTRSLLRDDSEPNQYSDDLLATQLEGSAVEVAGDTYYRPQEAAARVILSDSSWARHETTLGASATYRSANELALAIRRANRWIDDRIQAASGERPPSGRELKAVF